jgi:murein DD-endopeptidase MepM/ murein hydrolase activator NlpD
MAGADASRARTRQIAAVLAVVVAGTVLIATPAVSDPAADKRRIDQQLQRAEAALEHSTVRARQAGVAYHRASQLLPAAQQAVARAQGEVAAAQVQAATAARLAARARAALAAAEADLGRSERDVSDARDHLGEFVRASYQGAPYVAVNALLGARTPDQVMAGMGYLNNLASGERRAIARVSKVRLAAAQKRAEVAEVKRRVDEADALARQALGVAQQQEAAAEAARANVTSLVAQRRQSLEVAQEERAASAKQYAEVRAESRRIAAALREAARKAREEARRQQQNRPQPGRPPAPSRPRPGNDNAGGVLAMPVDGWKSSDFGRRYDPYYGVWQLHAGTDFAAPGGAAIRAADDGVVVRAGWNGGYGNYTCIYHGDLRDGRGLSTCYAHQSRIIADRGTHVGRGQTIGRVGTTGASTGNHLHFEVRLDGEPVNPMRWL